MIFYPAKFRVIRKRQKLSMKDVAEKMGLGWQTIWAWENKKRVPSETKLRNLCFVVNCEVSDVSDIESEIQKSTDSFTEVTNSWFSFIDSKTEEKKRQTEYFINKIRQQEDESNKASIMIKAIISSINAILYIKDKTLKYIMVNEKFLENISLPKSFDSKNKRDTDFFTVKDAKTNEDEDRYVLTSGKNLINKESIIPGSRKKKWGLISKIPIYDASNKIAGLIGVIIDITERRKAENLRVILEACIYNSIDGISIYSYQQKKYIYYNDAMSNIIGYDKEYRLKQPPSFWFNTCVHPDDRDKESKRFLKKEISSQTENRIIHPKKGIRWIRKSITTITLGSTDYGIAILRDITEEKEKLNTLKLLSKVLSSAEEVIWIYDISTAKIIFLSESVKNLYGYNAERFYKPDGNDFWINKCIHPNYYDLVNSPIKNYKNNEIVNYKIIDSSGNIKNVESRIVKYNSLTNYFAFIEKELKES
jgi:PAS domain S-box-containing protein